MEPSVCDQRSTTLAIGFLWRRVAHGPSETPAMIFSATDLRTAQEEVVAEGSRHAAQLAGAAERSNLDRPSTL
jgi:hypothetical protein